MSNGKQEHCWMFCLDEDLESKTLSWDCYPFLHLLDPQCFWEHDPMGAVTNQASFPWSEQKVVTRPQRERILPYKNLKEYSFLDAWVTYCEVPTAGAMAFALLHSRFLFWASSEKHKNPDVIIPRGFWCFLFWLLGALIFMCMCTSQQTSEGKPSLRLSDQIL